MKKTLKLTGLSISLLVLVACSSAESKLSKVNVEGQYFDILQSGPVSRNLTPYDDVFACFGGQMHPKSVSIAVGDIRDYTGKSSQAEGLAITQGGALMAYSALGKMEPGVQIHERFDTRIADAELEYSKSRQLGDGTVYSVPDAETGVETDVLWKPYFGGSVIQSDYYIVGGITELNYNIRSVGAELQVNQIGPKSREYVMNVAVDLRIVGSQSLKVYKTVSVQKQLVGREIGFGIFRFFETDLFDVNAGSKDQEPLQLGVRMAIEDAVLQLVSSISNEDPTDCFTLTASE
jgi:curli biogenesis system outer membrane secretion channel CsgG